MKTATIILACAGLVMLLLCAAYFMLPRCAKTSTPEGWLDDYEVALNKAAAENKHVLIDFSGSDWCGWCMALDEEVFSTDVFKKGAADKYVLLMVDSPRDDSLLSAKAAKQNPELVKKFDVDGFPTVIVLDPSGHEVLRTGYKDGGPEKYLEMLGEEIRLAPELKRYIAPIEDVLKRSFDEMLTAANSVAEKTSEPSDDAPEEEKRKHAEELDKTLINDVFGKYMPLVEKAVADAKAMNVPNSVAPRKQRILEKYENVLDNIKQAIKKVKSNEEAASEKVDGSDSTPSPEAQADKKRKHVASREDEAERAVVEREVNIDGHAWRYTVIGTNATIAGVLRATGSIEIPPEITVGSNTYAVTGIGRSTFSNRSSLRSVTIPDGVKEIGAGAFCDCTRLTSVSVPCSVTSIGDGAFDGCTGLRSFVVRVPSCVTNVGVVVVLCNDFITGFSVAEGNLSYQAVSGLLLSKDGKTLIHGVNGDVAIPDGVVRINRFAFSDCCRLTRVVIPRSVTDIGDHAFDRCSSVKSFAVDKDNPNYMSVNGMLLTKDGKTLIHGVNGDATVPDGVTCIGDGSFAGHTGLTRVTIPDSVTNIACNAFYGCSGLESIVVGRNNPNYKSINGMLLTKDGTVLVVMTKKDPETSTQKNWRGKWLMWIVALLVVAFGTYLVRKNKKRRDGGNGGQGKARKLELTYVTEKSEKETIKLFLRRRSLLELLRSCVVIVTVLWPIASVVLWFASMNGAFLAINYTVGALIVIAGTFTFSISYIRCQTNALRRAYRQRETHKVEYRLTDDALAFTAGETHFSSPWSKVARTFRVDKKALFLFDRDLPLEAQCVPDWQGHGVERRELISALRRAGLRKSWAWGKFVFWMAVAGILVWIISVAVRSDSGKALWWRMLGALGNAEAQYLLGECYEQGKGVRRDMHEAERWYLEAVEQGCRKAAVRRVMAQISFGYYYMLNNIEDALRCWRKAAEQGDCEAQYRLGERYHKGLGVERNPVEAVRWYRYAADGGHKGAQCALGCCYEKGEGVELDSVEAARWYHKAASKGSVEARKKIEAAKEADTKVPEKFQIASVDSNPAMKSQLSWKLLPPENALNVNSTQIRDRLELICDPADKVSGAIASVKPLISGGEKGFLVEVEDVVGEGRLGLSYDGCLPVYYDVKVRRPWLVPVASCRSAMKGKYDSAVFIAGLERGLAEGEVISPSVGKCGYRVLSISDNCVWFEAFYDDEPPEDKLPRGPWPDFSRIDTIPPVPPPGRLMLGKRHFWPGDAIKLPNSGWYLMVDDFLEGRGVVFRLLDSSVRPVRELLCVIVREER